MRRIISLILLLSSLSIRADEPSIQVTASLVRIPVNWEVMKSGFSHSAAASASETYVETWIYSQNEIDGSFLASPRTKVSVNALKRDPTSDALPELIVIQHAAFAKLLGLHSKSNIQEGWPVFLNLKKDASDPYELSFQSKEGELFSVLISLWR